MDHEGHSNDRSWIQSRTGFALLVFLGVAGFFLITEHGAHLFGVLPFLFLLLCPLMHVFMHGGHGGHGGSNQAPDGRER